MSPDPNVVFISTKLVKSYWPHCMSASHPVQESSELGVFHRSEVTQGTNHSFNADPRASTQESWQGRGESKCAPNSGNLK